MTQNLDRFKVAFWYMDTKEMYYADFFQNLVNPSLRQDIKSGKVIVSGCTGLKDKNGKLIYEGDIIEFMDYMFVKPELRRSEVVLQKSLDFAGNAVYYPFVNFTTGKILKGNLLNDKVISATAILTPPDSCEIIGNIYENPELLKSV